MTDIITFLENNRKYYVYTEESIRVIYHYLYMIGAPTTLTSPGQRSHHFVPLSSIKNDTAFIQPVVADLRMRQKIICK